MKHIKRATVIKRYKIIIIALSLGFISCKKEVSPQEIVQKSVNVHGTLEEWQKLKTLSFTKRTVLYNEDGTEKKQILQNHSFRFQNGAVQTFINSLLDSVSYTSVKGDIYKEKSASITKLEGQELQNIESLFASALYVASQPFQLIESGATFERESDTLIGGTKAYSIRVKYRGDSSISDQWTYYFSQDSYKVVACKVKHNNRVSVIENTSYDHSTPFLFNRTRKSTIVAGEKTQFVIAEYEYSNYKVTL